MHSDSPMLAPPPKLHCRPIRDADIDDIVNLLTRGFPQTGHNYWQRALEQMAAHDSPSGLPKYGQLLEHQGMPVGAILVIFSEIPTPRGPVIRGNLSSWYVDPAFRSYAGLMINAAIRQKNVTYINISPALHTRPIIEQQGFRKYTSGQFVAVPALARSPLPARVIPANQTPDSPFDSAEQNLLTRHIALGCIGLWCVTTERAYPFAFLPRAVRGIIPAAQLIYCGDFGDFTRFAGPIGRHLAFRGRAFVIVDSNGTIPGLLGRYIRGKAPKYFKGATSPTIGDIAYTEAVLFGL
jgi:hypothetical protein